MRKNYSNQKSIYFNFMSSLKVRLFKKQQGRKDRIKLQFIVLYYTNIYFRKKY